MNPITDEFLAGYEDKIVKLSTMHPTFPKAKLMISVFGTLEIATGDDGIKYYAVKGIVFPASIITTHDFMGKVLEMYIDTTKLA